MELNKMNKKTIIVVTILAILLTLSIIVSILGGEKDKNLENIEDTESNITDTIAPKADFAHRYVFTNDAANADFTGMFESIRDVSECTVKLIRFECSGNLGLMDEKALKSLTDKINTVASEEELKAVGSEEIPTEEGIYRAVMEIMDAHGNAVYEEVVLVLDKTGAKIEEAADKVVKVSKEKLYEEPEIDKSEYQIIDNVDGKIKAEDIVCELELRDEAKHEWLVHVSYVDRAGNESKATFLITVQEGKNETEATPKPGTSGNGGSNMGNINTGNGNNGGETTNSGSNVDNTNNSNGVSNNQDSTTDNSNNNESGSSNPNTDEWEKTPEWDEEGHINPYEQMAIDAGYWKVVALPDGSYAVLTHGNGETLNGKTGFDILEEYLAEKGLCSHNMLGCWINSEKGYYWYTASDIQSGHCLSPEDEEFWD